MDFIEDGYPSLSPDETEMLKEAAMRHSKFYTNIYKLNAELEENGEPVQTVRVMTQNMHARPEPFELTSTKFTPPCDPAYNFENRQTDRVINVTKGIKSLPDEIKPHVICFQELQGSKDKVMYANLTRSDPTDKVVYKRVDQCMKWDVRNNRVQTSIFGNQKRGSCLPPSAYGFLPGGLTTYSTLDIVFQTYHTFAVGTGGENVVSKGVLYSKIQISKPGKPEKYIHVLNCHPLAPITFARGECEEGILSITSPRNCTTNELRTYQNLQLKEIYTFKQSLQAGGYIKKNELVVYAGDMNINQYMALWETKEQEEIKTATTCCGEEFYSLLTKLKAEHPPVYLNPKPSEIGGQGGIGGHNGIFTWDGGENKITQSLLWPNSYTWIDYVLYSIENAKPLYADNFIVRFKQTEKLYEHGQVYQQNCFDWRNEQIKQLQEKPIGSINDFLYDEEMNYESSLMGGSLTNPEQKKLERLRKFQEGIYGDDYVQFKEDIYGNVYMEVLNSDLFYDKQPKALKQELFKIDDDPKNSTKPLVQGFQSNTAFEDVSDHYGVIATFILPSSDANEFNFNNLMKKRFNENIRHELFFNLPLQPIVIGINDNGEPLRLASRMDPRSPKMDTELWNRQTGTGRKIKDLSDERISRAAYISGLNLTAATNEKIYTVKKPRVRGKYAYSDCRDDNAEECQRKHPTAFDNLTHIRPILRMSDLQAMGIKDIDPRVPSNRYREPVDREELVPFRLATPSARRALKAAAQVQENDSLGMKSAQSTPQSRRRYTPRQSGTPRRDTQGSATGRDTQGSATPRQGGTPRQRTPRR